MAEKRRERKRDNKDETKNIGGGIIHCPRHSLCNTNANILNELVFFFKVIMSSLSSSNTHTKARAHTHAGKRDLGAGSGAAHV